ncbi:hypothetical protein G9A89_001439 [Geosiphon pyriformis]|nr:hypothetical protein G9A89_001439 [Geosiphon pyriformis]
MHRVNGKLLEVAAMHIVLTAATKMLIIDKAELSDEAKSNGQFAYSVEYDLDTKLIRPLTLNTNSFCSGGSFLGNGQLVESGGGEKTGGKAQSDVGFQALRLFNPCTDNTCDWQENVNGLDSYRWYPTMLSLPDGRVFILGGSTEAARTNTPAINNPTFEYYPKSSPSGRFPFLEDLTLPYNLYPNLNVVPGPEGQNLIHVFANTKSILWDYKSQTQTKTFDDIPGPPRTYPLTGTGLLLPLTYENGYSADFFLCGGTEKLDIRSQASNTCGKLRITDPSPRWEMEDFGGQGRIMADGVILVDGKVLFVNGAATGYAGYPRNITPVATDPVLSPVLYDPDAPKGSRWSTLAPSTIPRMYHSVASLVPDGTVFVSGSNPNEKYSPNTSPYPTELRIERFTPPYLMNGLPRPTILSIDGQSFESQPISLGYGKTIDVIVSLPTNSPNPKFTAAIIHYGFVTHSQSMSQRYVKIKIINASKDGDKYTVSVELPPNSNVIVPGIHYLHILNNGTPCVKGTLGLTLVQEKLICEQKLYIIPFESIMVPILR